MQNIDIILKPSRQFIALILFAIISSLLIVLFLPLTLLPKMTLILLIVGYGWGILGSSGLVSKSSSLKSLNLRSEGICTLHYPDISIEGEIQGDSTVTFLVCILRIAIKGERWKRSCVLFRDSMDRAAYRQLLLWLRCL